MTQDIDWNDRAQVLEAVSQDAGLIVNASKPLRQDMAFLYEAFTRNEEVLEILIHTCVDCDDPADETTPELFLNEMKTAWQQQRI